MLSRSKKHVAVFIHKEQQVAKLTEQLELHRAAKAVLERAVESSALYNTFLTSVQQLKGDTFSSVEDLMKRCESLMASRQAVISNFK